MAFEKPRSKTPSSIGWVTAHFAAHPTLDPQASIVFELLNPDGESVDRVAYDLISHITAGQRTTMLGFLSNMRSKGAAELEVAPGPLSARRSAKKSAGKRRNR